MSYDRNRKFRSIGYYDDKDDGYRGYDAMKDAKEKFYRNPEKYTADRHSYSNHDGDTYTRRNRGNERVTVTVEHWSGCSGERRAEDIKYSLEDEFPEVKFTEYYGREDSFEVFINGKILYSRIMQGGYPYVDEVLDAVWRAKRGKETFQIERYGGSGACNIL